MRFLHLHCSQHPIPDGEASAIAQTGGIEVAALHSIRPFETPVPRSALDGVSGAIIGGSAWSVFEEIPHYAAFRELLIEARRRKLPMFGICFGAQALAHAFGGRVERDRSRAEYGSIEVWREGIRDTLFDEVPDRFHAQAWHHDRIVDLPNGAIATAWSQEDMLQAFSFPEERIWGVQFHPERTRETFERLLETRPAPYEEHPIDKIRASLRPTPRAAAVLARFIRNAA